ncbi:MAG TPA: glycosyltransferase, partial [Parachlamydiaceae bacterium]|nr:glycosyltransferase [Parachlamydiaceae bacterium]
MTKKAFQFLFVLICTFIFSELRGDDHKICLTMIVRNEEKIIERCLNSARDVVDCICICDTGSTDNTVGIIEQFMRETGIPGKVYSHEWKNFGYNRTLSAEAAQEMLGELHFSLSDTHLLLLDADMILETGKDFSKDILTEDSFQLTQKNHVFAYYNTRLIRASLPWDCLGVTHEYWACKVPCGEARLPALSIDDRDDGGCKADKFERDIALLTQGLKDEPGNPRYVFYLATSFHCLNAYEEAIKWYNMRIEMGGWFEEIWYSKYMIGTCYEELDQWEHALSYYLDAYQFNSERAEPIQRISKYYRSNEEHGLAYFFAKQGAVIPYPKDQSLFISYPVYDYMFDEDISISAFYTPYKEEGYAAVNRLLLKKNVPEYIKGRAGQNALFYVKCLKNATYEPINIDLPVIREGSALNYLPMNPSIRKTEDGYNLICRTVNYLQIGAKHFQSLDILDPTNTVRTRNFFVEYDRDFNLLSQKEIIEELPREHVKFVNIEGLEDCRLFGFKGSDWFTCTTLDTNPNFTPQISLCKLEDERDGKRVHVDKFVPFMGPDLYRCEKNWLPFVKDGELHMIYSFDPFIVYKPGIEEKPCIINQDVLAVNVEQK